MRPDIVPGSTFPDYELPDHRGKKRKLSAIQRDDPMIVILSRGYHAPRSGASSGISSTSIRS
jgi:peroxiredoxin